MNGKKLGAGDNAENAKVLLGVREHYYSDAEIKGRVLNGKIRQFKR